VAADWYPRLQATGLLDTLAPYVPVVVGAYPLGLAQDDAPIEIVCRAVDLAAFARVLERAYGDREGFELHPGTLDTEDAVFAEFALDGLRVEVAGQREHVHRALGAATLGVARVIEQEGDVTRGRLAARVARGEDWLDAAVAHTGLSRTALEALATANTAVARRVLGVRAPAPSLRDYVVPLAVGLLAETLIVMATAGRRSSDFVGAMFLLEAIVLGVVFGARMGLVAALAPVALFGTVIASSIAVGSESCGSEGCAFQFTGYTFVAVLVGAGALVAGLLRDRYFPREQSG
jgi:hypothetical protein